MAYVEVKAKTVELAVEAAMRELGVTDRERVEVKVLQEPERGFLGMGGRDAIVKVEESRGGGKRGGRGRGSKGSGREAAAQTSGGAGRQPGSGIGRAPRSSSGRSPSGGAGRPQSGTDGGHRADSGSSGGGGRHKSSGKGKPTKEEDRDALGMAAQEPLVADFLTGLVDSFGLEGGVETRIDDDVIIANVTGDQTEALVGPRGSVMEAVHELTKTVLQRTAQDSARVRIDIAGYAERRRQALAIYAGDLIRQVLADGGEIMLEPMSASDRKVIHDAVASHAGVRSYSEGEAPKRFVVIAATGADEEE